MIICSNEDNESDATRMIIQEKSVDEHMKDLLAKWDLNWFKILKLEKKHMKAETSQERLKRKNDVSNEEKQQIKKLNKRNH